MVCLSLYVYVSVSGGVRGGSVVSLREVVMVFGDDLCAILNKSLLVTCAYQRLPFRVGRAWFKRKLQPWKGCVRE